MVPSCTALEYWHIPKGSWLTLLGVRPMALDRMIANFMTASTPIESYLQKDLPMTAMQWDLVAQTISSLQIFADKWKRKHG